VVAHYHPDWGIWDQFLVTETASALTRDGLHETFAIEIPGGEHVVINSSTAPIIYNKGGSILRMIEGTIGADLYREGVRAYLSRHAYGCAQSRHLWEAFEAVSAQPITEMMQSWIGQPGHPVVTVQRLGERLALHQQRFTYLPGDSEQTWIIPLRLKAIFPDGRSDIQALLMTEQRMEVALDPEAVAYKLNAGQTGFFRVAYQDADNLDRLGRLVRDRTLGPEDRWGLQNDLFAQVRQGSVPLPDYLAFIDHFQDEQAFLPLVSITANLYQACLALTETGQQPVVAAGRQLAAAALDRMGLEPVDGEPHTTATLRDQLIWRAAVWGADEVIAAAAGVFERMMAGEKVPADITRSVMQVGARTHGEKALEWFCRRFRETPNEHERMNLLIAMGAFDGWSLTARALAFALDHVPARNRFMPIVAAAANPRAIPYLWDWYITNRSTLEAFHPLLYERVITALVPTAGLGREAQVRTAMAEYGLKRPALADAIALAMENLDINSRMRAAS
jgi:aminopeptidase N